MQPGDERHAVGLSQARRIDAATVVGESLLAAGYRQQFDIEVDIPAPRQAEFLESHVEGLAMRLLGVRQRSVDSKITAFTVITPRQC